MPSNFHADKKNSKKDTNNKKRKISSDNEYNDRRQEDSEAEEEYYSDNDKEAIEILIRCEIKAQPEGEPPFVTINLPRENYIYTIRRNGNIYIGTTGIGKYSGTRYSRWTQRAETFNCFNISPSDIKNAEIHTYLFYDHEGYKIRLEGRSGKIQIQKKEIDVEHLMMRIARRVGKLNVINIKKYLQHNSLDKQPFYNNTGHTLLITLLPHGMGSFFKPSKETITIRNKEAY
jgi:hypothetical protein